MVLEILHLILLTATLLCGLVLAFYAHKIQAAQSRGLAFEDFRDGDQRRYRLETRHLRQVWQKELRDWLGDSRAILGKLHSIAAESSPHERDTRLAPAPSSPSPSLAFAPDTAPTRGAVPISRERMSPGAPLPKPHRALAPPASAPVLAPAPARIAAGLGPRPRSATHLASHRSKLTASADSAPPADTHPRFQGTMLSMPSVKEPGSARPVPWIETKRVCRECDGGFVAVGNGGIGQCYACEGSGFIHAL